MAYNFPHSCAKCREILGDSWNPKLLEPQGSAQTGSLSISPDGLKSNFLGNPKTCEEVKELLVTYVAILRGLYSLIRHHFSSPSDNDTWAQTSTDRSSRGEKTSQKFHVQCHLVLEAH
jgi:hypothetical protein